MKTIIVAAFVSFIVGSLAGGFGGIQIGSKTTRAAILPCPACNCPPAVEVKLAEFDVEKINNKRGTFNYNPTISNARIVIESKDSTLLKQLLKTVK